MNLITINIIIYIIIFKEKKILLYYIKHHVFTYEFNNNLIILISKQYQHVNKCKYNTNSDKNIVDNIQINPI